MKGLGSQRAEATIAGLEAFDSSFSFSRILSKCAIALDGSDEEKMPESVVQNIAILFGVCGTSLPSHILQPLASGAFVSWCK